MPKVSRDLRKVIRRIPKLPGTGFDSRTPGDTRFWAKLGDEDPQNPGHYKWTYQIFPSGNLTDLSPSIEAGNDYTARELGKTRDLRGRIVEVVLVGQDSDQKPVYVFAVAPPRFLPVSLTADGGSDGDASSPPSYTYKNPTDIITGVEIKNADGSSALGLSPQTPRNVGSFEPATLGLIYIDSGGNPVLWQVYETEHSKTCDPSN